MRVQSAAEEGAPAVETEEVIDPFASDGVRQGPSAPPARIVRLLQI